VGEIVFTPDGKTLISSTHRLSENYVTLWDTKTRNETCSLDTHKANWFSRTALSPDGKILATCSYDEQKIKLWDMPGKKQVDK
jgi:WD40 repeat protein